MRNRNRTIIVACILTVVLIPGFYTNANAYVRNDYYVHDMYNVTFCNAGGGYVHLAYENAKAAWGASAAPVYYQDNCSAYIVYADRTYYGKIGTVGRTIITGFVSNSCQGWARVTDAEIFLNGDYTDSYSDAQRQSVAAHEFGHPIGLGDESSDAKQLMYYTQYNFTKYGINTPQSDDVSGAQYIFNKCQGQ